MRLQLRFQITLKLHWTTSDVNIGEDKKQYM
jgi:hypothetical protein